MSDPTQIPTPTLGGGPLWDEIGRVGEFVLQRNRATGHHRLLDGANVRRAWGSLEDCEGALARLLSAPPEPANPNLALPTLGGMQFWADRLVRCGWRIQRNVFTGHCRLLDADDTRQAWGTVEQCEVAMRRLHEAADIEPASDHVVVLVHGMLGWKDRWAPMAAALRRQGFEVVDVNYPSTRASIEEHAEQLAEVIENLPEHERLDFVTHSMGALIVRRLLAEHDEIEAHRVLMIAPPNHGLISADLLCDLFAYHLVYGPSGPELVTGARGLADRLPPPPCEFGVIAGGRPPGGFNPRIPGDDDGLVEVESTRLEGMSDFLLVEALHTRILRRPEVVDAAVSFLRHGRF
jgi:pimeloyl-ACP methyl ester carboxylesterase